MASARKRPRVEPEDDRAECPFIIRIINPKDKDQRMKKRRRTEGSEEDDSAQRINMQLSPFAPSGKFKTYETLDIHYQVEPAMKWRDMTRYNSFVRKLSRHLHRSRENDSKSQILANHRLPMNSQRC